MSDSVPVIRALVKAVLATAAWMGLAYVILYVIGGCELPDESWLRAIVGIIWFYVFVRGVQTHFRYFALVEWDKLNSKSQQFPLDKL